jgi:hypothetical protein
MRSMGALIGGLAVAVGAFASPARSFPDKRQIRGSSQGSFPELPSPNHRSSLPSPSRSPAAAKLRRSPSGVPCSSARKLVLPEVPSLSTRSSRLRISWSNLPFAPDNTRRPGRTLRSNGTNATTTSRCVSPSRSPSVPSVSPCSGSQAGKSWFQLGFQPERRSAVTRPAAGVSPVAPSAPTTSSSVPSPSRSEHAAARRSARSSSRSELSEASPRSRRSKCRWHRSRRKMLVSPRPSQEPHGRCESRRRRSRNPVPSRRLARAGSRSSSKSRTRSGRAPPGFRRASPGRRRRPHPRAQRGSRQNDRLRRLRGIAGDWSRS